MATKKPTTKKKAPAKKKTARKKAAKKKPAPKKKATTQKKPATQPEPTPPDPPAPPLTQKQRYLLEAIKVCGNVTTAAKKAGMCRQTHYLAMEKSETYRVAYADAVQQFADLLRASATHRAITGVDRYKFYAGVPCCLPVFDNKGNKVIDPETGEQKMQLYVEKEYSDQLLLNLLRANCPEFVDRKQIEHSGPDGGPIQSQADVKHLQSIDQFSAENLMHATDDETEDGENGGPAQA